MKVIGPYKLVRQPTIFKKKKLGTNHVCRHLTASWRTALFESSRHFDIARRT